MIKFLNRKALSAVLMLAAVLLSFSAQAQSYPDQLIWGGSSGGSANAQTITIPNLTTVPVGVPFRFIPGLANTGSATLKINTTSAITVKKQTAGGLALLTGGELQPTVQATVLYDGSALQLMPPTTSVTLPTISALRANTVAVPSIYVLGYLSATGPGGGTFNYIASDTTSADNNCTIIVDAAGHRFRRALSPALKVTECGAAGDGVTDDTAAEQAGINAILNGGNVNTIQGAPAGELYWPPGTYKTTASLVLGPNSLNTIGINMRGAGATVASIFATVSGPVFTMAIDGGQTAKLSDMLILNNAGSSLNTCVTVTGNTIILRDLHMNCAAGIVINGGTDDFVDTVQCDGCLGPALVIESSHNINVSGLDIFGNTAASNGIQCYGTSLLPSYDINISGVTTIGLGTDGVSVGAYCNMTLSNYAIDGSFSSTTTPATHRGFVVGPGTAVLHLGAGVIRGWEAEGIFIGGGLVYDNGADINSNVFSASATNRYPVANTDGTYIKTGGVISGGLSELGLVFINGNNDTTTSITGTLFNSSQGYAVNAVAGGGGIVEYVNITDNIMTNLNLANSSANTPIIIGAANMVRVSSNTIATANAVTAAITVTSGTNIITYNSSHSGTFPANSGTNYSVGNVNF